jgi:hypothetical protein
MRGIALMLVAIAIVKFTAGAWIVVLLFAVSHYHRRIVVRSYTAR